MKSIVPFIISCLLLLPFIVSAQDDEGLKWFVLGEGYRNRAQFTPALNAYSKAVAENSQAYRYHFGKAQCEYHLRMKGESLKSLSKVVELNKKYAPAYELMARIYISRKEKDKASQLLRMAFRYEESLTKKFNYISFVIKEAIAKKDYVFAKKLLAEAKIVAPKKASLYYLEAKVGNVIGTYDAAKNNILKVEPTIATWPMSRSARYYFELGYAYYNLEEYKTAEKVWQKANYGIYKKKIYLLSPAYFSKVARAYEQIYDYEESEKFIDQVLKIASDLPDGYVLSADIFIDRSPHSDVLVFYEEAVKYEKSLSKRAELYEKMAVIYLQGNSFDKATQNIDKALAFKPSDAELLFVKGLILYKLGDYNGTVRVLDKAVHKTRHPQQKARAFFLMGMALKKLKNSKRAKQAFNYANVTPFKDAAAHEINKINGVRGRTIDPKDFEDIFEGDNFLSNQ